MIMDTDIGWEKWDEPFIADENTAFIKSGFSRGQRALLGVYDDAMSPKVSNGIIGTWEGTPIRFCKCGGTPHIYGEGVARQDVCGGTGTDIYFVDFDGYAIECEECGESVCYCRTVEGALKAWNSKMEE
jgi:hypothetical protein